MIINSTNLRSAYVSFSAAYQGAFNGVTPTWRRIAMEVQSSTRMQEYGWLGDMPNIREWIGERQINNLQTYSYAIRNRSWESTIGVDRDDMEDDNLGIYAPRFTMMGKRTAEFPERLLWPMLPAGFNAPCFDGQNFFDTDHPVLNAAGVEVSVSNTQGGSGTPWYLMDTKAGFMPLVFQNRKSFQFVAMDSMTDERVFMNKEFRYGVDGRNNAGYGMWQVIYASRQPLTADNYGLARQAMMAITGNYGSPLGIKPDLLIVPPALESAGLRIVKQGLTPVIAAGVPVGAENIYAGTAELLVQPWLA